MRFLCNLFVYFVKITGFPVYLAEMRAHVYLDEGAERRIRGGAILVSSHRSVYDFALYLYVFFGRVIRFLMAEVLFEKKLQGLFLKTMGGIEIDRDAHSFDCLDSCEKLLRRGHVVGIFPEGRLPKKNEERPLRFHEGAAMLALSSGMPIIPVATDGRYFKNAPASVIIGKKIYARELVDETMDEKTSVETVNTYLREEIIRLEAELERRKQQK